MTNRISDGVKRARERGRYLHFVNFELHKILLADLQEKISKLKKEIALLEDERIRLEAQLRMFAGKLGTEEET